MTHVMDFIAPIGSSPEVLALSILISTFLLEDVAIGYAGLLAAAGAISAPLAFIAMFLGVYSGDLGLYFVGVTARNYQRARRYIGEDRLARAREWLEGRAIPTLVIARVLPGSRLPIYAAGGYLQLPFQVFAGTTAATSLTWTSLLFSASYVFGIRAASIPGSVKYGIVLIVALSLIAGPMILKRQFRRSAEAPAG